MKDIEKHLESLSTAEPPASLDARMERLWFDEAALRPGWWRRPVALWQTAAACLVAGAIGYGFHPESPAPPVAPEQPPQIIERTVHHFYGTPQETWSETPSMPRILELQPTSAAEPKDDPA